MSLNTLRFPKFPSFDFEQSSHFATGAYGKFKATASHSYAITHRNEAPSGNF